MSFVIVLTLNITIHTYTAVMKHRFTQNLTNICADIMVKIQKLT